MIFRKTLKVYTISSRLLKKINQGLKEWKLINDWFDIGVYSTYIVLICIFIYITLYINEYTYIYC